MMKSELFLSVLICAAIACADDPKLGETWYVSTAKLTLRAKPDALSKAVGELKYKDAGFLARV